MADDQKQPEDDFSSLNISSDGDEADWGEDWESAFQAEDDMFFAEGGEDDLFLDEDKGTESTKGTSQDLTTSLEQSLENVPDQEAASTGTAGKFSFPAPLTALFSRISTRPLAPLFQRLQALPLWMRIPVTALPLLLVGSLFFLLGGEEDLTGIPGEPPALVAKSGLPDGSGPVSAESTPELPAEQTLPEKVRKKWMFPAFLIPVSTQSPDQPVAFVMVDITLVTALDESEAPPSDKKIFMRDAIYQFYTNRPIEELRRFSLARGEMNRKLRAWLQKQWPEAPIESIIFTRYHLT